MTPDSEAEGCKVDGCKRDVNPDLNGLCDAHWATRADLRKD